MEHHGLHNPAVTVAVAMAAGMIAQSLARHLRLPGIVLLLGAGVLLGPDLIGIVQPDTLGPALQILVGFAVAVILFEGGMNLNLKRIRSQAKVIRRLLTIGAFITAAGATVAARLLMEWPWQLAILFGTLVIVTGPTVITPLLRRIKVHHKVETVLEAEGVLIDAVGAVVAVVALEVALGFSGRSFAQGFLNVFGRVGFGLIFGMIGGFAIALMLRYEKVVPEGLENVFTLSFVLALFQLSNHFPSFYYFEFEESGIVTVTAAGMVLGNLQTRVHRDLLEFKEQLTVMLIGMLFVLLAAGVRVEEVQALGWAGIGTVLALMLVVRPLNIGFSTLGSDLNLREKAFLSWLAPRGIVAAAVASLFAQKVVAEGIPGGHQLQPLVFMVIAMTVLIQGLSGGMVARFLGLQRATNLGYAILGANELGHAMGRLLRDSGEEVTFLDGNPSACHVVEQDGFKVVFGNVLEERTLLRAQLDDRAAVLACTTNEEANLLFARHAVADFKVPNAYVATTRGSTGVNEAVVRKNGGAVLFGVSRDIELWALRLRRRMAPIEIWSYDPPEEIVEQYADERPFETPENRLLPMVIWRGDSVFPVNDKAGLRAGDVVHIAIFLERQAEAREWLTARGWTPVGGEGEAGAVDPELEAQMGEAEVEPAESDS